MIEKLIRASSSAAIILLLLGVAGCAQSGATTDQSMNETSVNIASVTAMIAIVISVVTLILALQKDRRNKEHDAIAILDRLTSSDMARARDIVGRAAHLQEEVRSDEKDDLRQAMFRLLWETQCVVFLRKEIKGKNVITMHAQVIYRHLDLMIDSFNEAHKKNPELGDFSPSLEYANDSLNRLPKIKSGFLTTVQEPPGRKFRGFN